jgi:hypothetical protein
VKFSYEILIIFVLPSYVELQSNERTDFKARELKSVHVDAEGTFLKLIIHKNFVNRLNFYNQVTINFQLRIVKHIVFLSHFKLWD